MQTGGKVMMLMIFLIGIATGWKFLNALVGSEPLGHAAAVMTSGPLANSFWVFEIGIGLVLPFVVLLITRLESVQAMSLAALMILVGQFFARLNLVVAGQIIPQYPGYEGIPTYHQYSATAPEIAIALSGIGVLGACFLIGEYYLGESFRHHHED